MCSTCRNPRRAFLFNVAGGAHCVYATFIICLLRYAAIINYNVCVSFNFHLLSARLSWNMCTAIGGGGRGGCATVWFMNRPEKRNAVANCLRTLARFSRQNTHTKTSTKMWDLFGELQTGFIKYQRTFQSKSIWTLIAQLQGMTWHPGCDSQFE